MSAEEAKIIESFALLVVSILVPVAVSYAAKLWYQYKEQLIKQDWFYFVDDTIKKAVTAAEQLGLTDQLSAYGNSKYNWAVEAITASLEQAGVPVDLRPVGVALKMAIEAEVRRQFPKQEQ